MFQISKFFIFTFFVFMTAEKSFAQEMASVRPWLGIAIEKGNNNGVLIKSTYPDTPAEKAGLMANDEVLSVDKKKVETPEQLIGEITNKGVGHKVEVEFLRAGKKETKTIALVAMPDITELTRKKFLNKPLPQISGTNLKSGKSYPLTESKGKTTILKFWATWCPSCVATEPRLLEFSRANSEKVQIVNISSEESPILKKHLAKLKKVHPDADKNIINLQDPEGAISKEFVVSSIPLFILVDKKGMVREVEVGAGEVLEELLKKSLTIK